MSEKLFKNTVGQVIILETGEDLTGANVLKIKVKKPDNTKTEWDGSVYQTTKIKYTTVLNDLNVAGNYKLQSYVEYPDWRGTGETVELKVYEEFAKW